MNNREFLDQAQIIYEQIEKCEDLTNIHKESLVKIYRLFDKVLNMNNIKNLETFDFSFSVDNELLLYKRSEDRLINIIIDPEEEFISFSYIPVSNDIKCILYFTEKDGDYKKNIYDFLTH